MNAGMLKAIGVIHVIFSAEAQFILSHSRSSGRFAALSGGRKMHSQSVNLSRAAEAIQGSLIIFGNCISKQSSVRFPFFSEQAVREAIVDENKPQSCGLTETHNGALLTSCGETKNDFPFFSRGSAEIISALH